jgi:hypothetical protein
VSEYQYYEFLALDRPLSVEAIASVRALSRRVQPTPTQAIFTYSYGDFPGQPLDLLAKHYDVMLYLANWGSKQLAFRFPKGAIDEATLQPYYYGVEEIELRKAGDYLILTIAFHDEGGDWIEEEGHLTPLAPLRDDLLRGDLRALYLAWLASASRWSGSSNHDDTEEDYEDVDDEEGEERVDEPDGLIEPLVPAGLGQLSAPLQAFADFFQIDQDLIAAAAEGSPALTATREPIERWVPLLSETERTAFLVRAATGEPIGAELLRRLRQIGGAQGILPANTTQRRTFRNLQAAATHQQQQRAQREHQATERARLAKLEALAKREAQVWASIPALLAKRTTSGYDEGVMLLAELRDLAVHRGQRGAFDAKLAEVTAPYIGSVALQRRLKEKRLE